MKQLKTKALLLAPLAYLLVACSTSPSAPPTELSIFSLNDFHGHIQSKLPTPATPRLPDPKTGEIKPQPAGGVAYLATVLDGLRSQRKNAIFVAAGDLVGASPQMSSLLKDEPTLSALSELGLAASSLGNHDLDAGLTELLRKTRGECPVTTGCVWPEFKGAKFPYLAANMFEADTGKRVLPSHVMQEVGGFKVALVGAVTKDTPKVIMPKSIVGLRFADEADTLNALVPELRAAGAHILVAIMHEGARFDGGANDTSYACPGLSGRGIDVAKRLDPAYAIVISGHTHQAYTCKIDGRLFVQAGAFGGWLTESRLTVSADGKVLDAQAVNHPVLQGIHAPNPAFTALVARAAELTNAARNKPVALLTRSATRSVKEPFGDSALGNLVADAHLAYAKKRGNVDIGMTNSGGIRADLVLEKGQAATLNDLFAVQPFGNDLIAMTITGAQLQELIARQLRTRSGAASLQISHNLSYVWSLGPADKPRLESVLFDGQPLDLTRDYRVVVNQFMADGGNDMNVLKQGRDRWVVGPDLEAFEEWVRENPKAMEQIESGRIVKR